MTTGSKRLAEAVNELLRQEEDPIVILRDLMNVYAHLAALTIIHRPLVPFRSK